MVENKQLKVKEITTMTSEESWVQQKNKIDLTTLLRIILRCFYKNVF